MRTRLQLKLPIILGVLLFCGHSLLVILLRAVSQKNIEMGVLWEHMRLTDLPVSMLLDKFYDAYWKAFPQGSYPKPEVLFHLTFGGLQFLLWGCLLGTAWNRLVHRTTTKTVNQRCPAANSRAGVTLLDVVSRQHAALPTLANPDFLEASPRVFGLARTLAPPKQTVFQQTLRPSAGPGNLPALISQTAGKALIPLAIPGASIVQP